MNPLLRIALSVSICAFFSCAESSTDPEPQTYPDASSTEDAATENDSDVGIADQGISESMDASNGVDAGIAESDAAMGNADASITPRLCNPSFSEANACGGDIVGIWTYSEGCIDRASLGMVSAACQTATLSNELQVTTGTLTVTANRNYTRQFTDLFTVDINVPSACVSFVGSCTGIEDTIRFVEPRADIDCPSNGRGGCDCKLEIKKSVDDFGTVITSTIGEMRLIPDDSSMEAGDYYFCSEQGILQYKGFTTTSEDHSVTYVLNLNP